MHCHPVGAYNASGETLCANRTGEFDFTLATDDDVLDDVAVPLNVGAVITDAQPLASLLAQCYNPSP